MCRYSFCWYGVKMPLCSGVGSLLTCDLSFSCLFPSHSITVILWRGAFFLLSPVAAVWMYPPPFNNNHVTLSSFHSLILCSFLSLPCISPYLSFSPLNTKSIFHRLHVITRCYQASINVANCGFAWLLPQHWLEIAFHVDNWVNWDSDCDDGLYKSTELGLLVWF